MITCGTADDYTNDEVQFEEPTWIPGLVDERSWFLFSERQMSRPTWLHVPAQTEDENGVQLFLQRRKGYEWRNRRAVKMFQDYVNFVSKAEGLLQGLA